MREARPRCSSSVPRSRRRFATGPRTRIPARAAAQERLEASLGALAEEGVDARGEVGDADPIQAIDDALRTFGADEIIISTHPPGRSNWLEKQVIVRARERYELPITHVVVDLVHEAERATGAAPKPARRPPPSPPVRRAFPWSWPGRRPSGPRSSRSPRRPSRRRRHVGGDVDRVLPGHEVGRHLRRRVQGRSICPSTTE